MQPLIRRFNTAELLTFAYIFITAVYVLLTSGQSVAVTQTYELLFYRVGFAVALFIMAYLSEKSDSKFVGFIRYVFPFALITYWYPETYSLGYNTGGDLPTSIIAPNLDGFFDRLDRAIFGCSPAMEFSKALPQALVSEIMYFGYFAYYLIFLFLFVYCYIKMSADLAEKAMFYCLCSFFVYYVIFTLVPVAGPQFYYSCPDNQVPEGYIFSALMRSIQDLGEKPTGAFPSSHVGLTIIAMILLYKNARKYFYAILPAAIVLVASTVYIKAHYLIDVVVAIIVTPFIFILSKLIFRIFKRCNL
jgi:membrane-associated phospholipid phosphatase